MGFVPFTHLHTAYARIRAAAGRRSATSVVVFVGADGDGVCALRILLRLFKADCIAHVVVPVAGLDDLAAGNTNLIENNDEIRSIILVNSGGLIELETFFSLNDNMTIYLTDSHRPIHLKNLFGTDKVIFLDDGEADELKEVQEAFENIEFGESEDEMEGSDYDDDEESPKVDEDPIFGDEEEDDGQSAVGDGEEGGEPGRRKKRRKEGEEDGKDPTADISAARKKAAQMRKRRRDHRELIMEYYTEGSYHGSSTSSIMYTLASQLGRASSDLLWMAIIGLTHQYLHDRMDQRRYRAECASLKAESTRFEIPDAAAALPNQRRRDNIDDDDPFGPDPLDEGNPRQPRISNGPSIGVHGVRTADDRTITPTEDHRLMLLRHWSLHDAIYHSTHVATRLGVWRAKGLRRLTNMLVKMGFPHRECRQPFTEMDSSFRRDLKARLVAVAPAFGLGGDMVFESFVRHFGYKCSVSASDAVYGITALLDCGASWLRRVVGLEAQEGATRENAVAPTASSDASARAQWGMAAAEDVAFMAGVGVGTRMGAFAVGVGVAGVEGLMLGDGDDEGENEPPVPGETEEEKMERIRRIRRRVREREWIRNFYIAFDALENVDLLYHGIHLSMQFQRALLRAAVSILDKQITKTLKAFRLTVLAGASVGSEDHNVASGSRGMGGMVGENEFLLFGRSVALLGRLASFIMEAYREHKKNLPLVIAAYNDETDAYLVLGSPGSKRSGDIRKNPFGIAFQLAAERTGASIRNVNFDSSVAEVSRDDLLPFLENLQFNASQW